MKYTIAVMPAAICPCGPQPMNNVLSLGCEQVQYHSGDSREMLDNCPSFQVGKSWRTITCCRCRKDKKLGYLAIFQKMREDAIDFKKIKPYSIEGLDSFTGWRLAGLCEAQFGFKYSLN